MGLKFKLAGLLLVVMSLTATVFAIEWLRETTYWDVAEINGITVGEFHPIPWVFKPYNPDNAIAGTVEAPGAWAGTWKEVGCDTLYCEITSGGYDKWYLTFINPKYFIAYKDQYGYSLYRLGIVKGEYTSNTLIGGA